MVELDRTLIAIIVVIVIVVLIILIAVALFRERRGNQSKGGRSRMDRIHRHGISNKTVINQGGGGNYSQPGSCQKSCGCQCDKPCGCEDKHEHHRRKKCELPCAPVLHCQTWLGDGYVPSCGFNGEPGTYHIQWHSQCDIEKPIIEYRIYAIEGYQNVPTIENAQQIFVVSGDQFHFDSPDLGFCWNFIVTSVNECGESEPSDVYFGPCMI